MAVEHVHRLPRWLTIAFTGHRTVVDPHTVAAAIEQAIDRCGAVHARIAGISSVASGSDTLFAEAIHARRYPFSLVLPFPCERFHWDFEPGTDDWPRAEKLIQTATSVEVIYPSTDERQAATRCAEPPATPPDPIQIAKDPAQRKADDDAYMDAAYRAIDRADAVIAVWNGQPAAGWGGTAYAVAYAQNNLKPLILIDPETGALTQERIESLKARFSSDQHGTQPSGDEPIIQPRQLVYRYQQTVGDEAMKHGPLSRLLVTIALMLFLAASTAEYFDLVFRLDNGWHYFASAIVFAFIVAGTLVMLSHGKRHDRWLRYRIEAEVCQSFLQTWDIRKHATLSHLPRPPLPGMTELFSTLRMLRELDAVDAVDFESTRYAYENDRVTDQLEYFKRKWKLAHHALRRGRAVMKTLTVISLLCSFAAIYVSIEFRQHDHAGEWLHLLAAVLPLAVTATGIALITTEATRRTVRYKEMIHALLPLQRRLRTIHTWDALARLATEVEEELLQELIEWRSFIRFTRDVARPE